MNCETYIVTSQSGKLSFFPDNFDTVPLRKSLKQGNVGDNELAVLRRGDMVYYVYLRQLLDCPNEFVGVAVALNSIVIVDVAALHEFFQKIMRSMAAQYNIAKYKKDAGTYCSSKYTQYPEAAVKRLRTVFNSRLGDKGLALGPSHYSGTPGNDTIRVKEDHRVMRIFTDENKYAQLTVRQSVERGNLVIVSSEITDEKEIAQLNAQLAAQKEIITCLQVKNENLKQANQELRQKAETVHSTQVQTQESTTPAAKENVSNGSWLESFFRGFLGTICLPLPALYYFYAHRLYSLKCLIQDSEVSWFQYDILLGALIINTLCGCQKIFNGYGFVLYIESVLVFIAYLVAYEFDVPLLNAFTLKGRTEYIMVLAIYLLSILGLYIGSTLREKQNHKRK